MSGKLIALNGVIIYKNIKRRKIYLFSENK